jgi:hypothetical protein
MKIIDIGICTDNVDPKGIGRIRCVRYSDYVGEKEKALTYEKWDDKDTFVALPFLPSNINFIPEIGQAVKIINYNVDKEHVNQEYIAGPFTTMFDFNSQTFSQQVENTSYGVPYKNTADIINKESGIYIENKSEGVFAKNTDYGVYGKFGSDIIFTENGLQLRGGKLLSKEAASAKNRKKMLVYPLMTEKSSSLYLKKFPKKMELSKKKEQKIVVDVQPLKYVIEHELDSLTNPTVINFYMYKVLKSVGRTYQSDFFNENTPLQFANIKLINTGNTQTDPTFSVPITSTDEITSQIRTVYYDLHEDQLKETIRKLNINIDYTTYPDEDIHPFYFRPTSKMINLKPNNNTEQSIKDNIFNFKLVTGIGPGSGLVWSRLNMKIKPTIVDTIVDFLKTETDSNEQTFSALKSDKIYLLSTDTNPTDKIIKFNDLNKYEYTQEDYVLKIDPNTYSTVRGENLIKFLQAFYIAFLGHVHNINQPYVKNGYDPHVKLEDLFKSLENDILNKSIRIN